MAEDPRPDFEPSWDVCNVAGHPECRGALTQWGPACLVHVKDLSPLGPGSDLDLRGVAISSAMLMEIRARFRDPDTKRYVFGEVRCDHTWFNGRAQFHDTDIQGSATFRDAHFGHLTRFDGTVCAGEITFRGARFPGKALMSGMVAERIDLNRAWFASRVEIEANAKELTCVDGRFEAGLVLKTEGAVDASGAYFGAPSTISLAKVTSLANSDTSNLVLAFTDLSDCKLVGAHRLEQMRLDGVTFARPAGWWRARRRMLAEEGEASGTQMATVYRALRKSFEDNKFEAGAGDFYYGEMECRRQSKDSSRAERVILWFYWLLSGYGQRASRALVALLVVITTVTTLLTVWGQDFGMAARTALNAVVFRDDQLDLDAASEWTVLVARVMGPLLLALAVLAIRARVKR